MRKIIKKTGNSACIILDREDMAAHELKIGDVLEIELEKIKDE